jgi:hypothetical protein
MTNVVVCLTSEDITRSWCGIRAICIMAGVCKDVFYIFFLSYKVPEIRDLKLRLIIEGISGRGIQVGLDSMDNI